MIPFIRSLNELMVITHPRNKKNTPKYMDYVILGNMIVLCPIEISSSEIGATEPLDNCRLLLSKLPELNK